MLEGNRGLEPDAELDLLLRASLETYADPGRESGLAERVLARIAIEGARERTHRTNRTRRISRWAVALPIAACSIVAIVLLASRPPRNSADRTNQARVTSTNVTLPKSTSAGADRSNSKSPSITARRNVISRPLRHSSRAAVTTARLPKLDVFPTPQPLTPAEKEFISYVAKAPQAERQSLIEEQRRIDAPLTIAALEIQPLEPPEPQGN
jgi:hypothetical protein